MAVKLIYNHIEHHAARSGYDQLAKYVDGQPYRKGPLFRLAQRLPEKWLQRFQAWHTPWYWGDAMPRELEICGRVLLPRRDLYHFLYAENDLRLASVWRLRLNNKIVATFHQPPEYLEHHVADKAYIRGLDAAVVVSRYQIPYMMRFLPHGKIFHVPHGVDCEYWKPDAAVDRWPAPTFLFVGFWLRDVDLFSQTVRRVAALDPAVRFRVITPAQHAAAFADLPNTTVRSGIADAELLDEYRRAHALFLPLKAATANNSVLEALSTGTAVITTTSGGVIEYVDEHSAIAIAPGDVEAAVGAVLAIARDRARAAQMGAAARRRAQRYRWETVGAQMSYVHRRILGKSCRADFRSDAPGPRNVCLVTEEYPPETGWGGIATYNYNLAQGLAQAGHRVFVIAGCTGEPSTTRDGEIEVHRVRFEPRTGWRRRLWQRIAGRALRPYPEFQRRLEFALAARKRFRWLFDRVPLHVLEAPEYFGSAWFVQRMRRRCPVVVKLHTPTEVNCWINSLPVTRDVKLSSMLEKGSTRRAELVTAPSRKIIEIVRSRWLPRIGPIELLEYPIDAALYSPADGQARAAPRHFLFTGRLEHRKGVHVLVQAFDRVSDALGDVELHLAGHDTPTFSRNGGPPTHFKEYLDGMPLRPATRAKIRFLGRVPLRELIPLYRAAFACIIPSVSFENFPNSCLEALSCGKAVIVSDAGGMVEMAPHEVSGLAVRANDVDALAAAMRYLAEHPDETARFGRSARAIVLERYATDVIITRTVDAYERVIRRSRYR